MLSDGVRWAAYMRADRQTVVVDATTGGRYVAPTPAGFSLAAVGGGQALWVGPVDDAQVQRVVLWDLRRRVAREPEGWAKLDDYQRSSPAGADQFITFSNVGRFGLAGTVTRFHDQTSLRFNWRNGALVVDDPSVAPKATEITDLDAATLSRRLCGPLRQQQLSPRAMRGDQTGFYLSFGYARPWGLTYAGPRGRVLMLQRCAHDRATVLTRACPAAFAPCSQDQLGGGWATWDEPELTSRAPGGSTARSRIVAYRLRDRRRYAWTTPKAAVVGFSSIHVAHTTSTIYASFVPAGETSTPARRQYKIVVSALPRAQSHR